MLETLRKIFPAVHTHPAKHLHEFSQFFDPMTSELQPDEHGCGEVREMRLSLSFERDGRRFITVN